MKIVKAPLTSEKAYDLYRQFEIESSSELTKAIVLAIICVSIKLLGVEIAELALPGVKVTVANARYISGVLGWLMIWCLLESMASHYNANYAKRFCSELASGFGSNGPSGVVSQIIFYSAAIVTVLVVLTTVLMAFALTLPDMYYVVVSALRRFVGLEAFMGQWDTCIRTEAQPS